MFPAGTNGQGNETAHRALIALGGALLTIAPYLTWLHVVILGDFNLTGLLSAGHASVGIAYAVTAIGVALVLIAVLARSIQAVRTTALVCGSVILLGGGWATYGLIRAVSNSAGLGQVGPGPIMAVISSVLLIVPPLVANAQRPATPFYPGQPVWRTPTWLPGLIACGIGAAVAWVPYHAGVNNYCGTAVGAAFKSPSPTPSLMPPGNISSALQQDQTAVTAAQAALNAQGQSDANASQKQNAANSLSSQAQQSDSSASNLQTTVYSDQGTVDGDQGTVAADQSTVGVDQQTLSDDQGLLKSDQQMLASDQQAGFDTSDDQSSIAEEQQTIATDQATLAKDQQTLQSDQAALNQAESVLGSDQKALASAQANASQLDQQAQVAENSAQSASESAAQSDEQTQQQLSDAQQQLQSDEQNWQNTYDGQLTATNVYNASLRACQHQANDHFIAASVVAIIGLLISGVLFINRRGKPPAPRLGWQRRRTKRLVPPPVFPTP